MQKYQLSLKQALTIWERGVDLHPIDRALLCISETDPKVNKEIAEELSLGKKNEILMRIYECNFGPIIECNTECLNCSEEVEFDLSLTEWYSTEKIKADENIIKIESEGSRYHFRLLNSRDIAAVLGMSEPEKIEEKLLRLCLLDKVKNFNKVSRKIAGTVGKKMLAIDPLVELIINLKCPRCSNHWEELFDIESMLWKMIEGVANRYLDEVHLLAFSYGWSENEIMHMSPERRYAYIKRIEL